VNSPERIAASDAVPASRLAWIAGALNTAAQPSRLAVGFVVALLLWAPGLAWDAAVGPVIDPPGLLAEPWDDIEQADAERTMRRLAAQLVPDVSYEGARVPAAELAATLASRAVEAGDDPQADRLLAAARRVRSLAPLGSFQALAAAQADAWSAVIDGTLALDPRPAFAGLRAAAIDVPAACARRDPVFAAAFGAWALLVLAIGAGAFARMECVQSADRGLLDARGALRFAAQRWPSLLMSWVGPVVIAGLVGLLCVAFGLLFRTTAGGWAGALLYVLPLALGAIGGLALVLAALGAPTAPAAVAVDGLDALEASQRGGIYFLARPVWWIVVMLASLAVVAAGLVVLRILGWALTAYPAFMVGIGSGGVAPDHALAVSPARWWLPIGGPSALVWGWVTLFGIAVTGTAISLVAGVATRAYLLLREACDGQPTGAIWPYEVPADVTDRLPPANV
jgi:hypothetical protein